MPNLRTLRAFDWLERGLILALYAWLVARIVGNYLEIGLVANLILLVCEGLVVILVIFRRGTSEISLRPSDWVLAFCATVAPLSVVPGAGRALLSPEIAAMMMLIGVVVQMYGKVALGRSFGCVPAHRGLSLGGPYRIVRHPIYAGYLICHLAFALTNPVLWNFVAYGVLYAVQVPRLLAEERLLSRDPCYRAYMQAVRYRLVPGLY